MKFLITFVIAFGLFSNVSAAEKCTVGEFIQPFATFESLHAAVLKAADEVSKKTSDNWAKKAIATSFVIAQVGVYSLKGSRITLAQDKLSAEAEISLLDEEALAEVEVFDFNRQEIEGLADLIKTLPRKSHKVFMSCSEVDERVVCDAVFSGYRFKLQVNQDSQELVQLSLDQNPYLSGIPNLKNRLVCQSL